MEKEDKRFSLGKLEVGFIAAVGICLVLAAGYAWLVGNKKTSSIDSFETCVAAGNPVMESYPEQCSADGKTFTNPRQTAPSSPETE